MARKRGNPGLQGQLLERSIEAYILSLETVNRLSIRYRIETFTYLICNAWELLLKAKILLDADGKKESIFLPKGSDGKSRTISLRDCLNKIYPNRDNPIRKNLATVIDLRDMATHLVISKVPPLIMGLFQANVLNYHKALGEWFDTSLSKRVPVGMMTLVYDFDVNDFDFSSRRLRKALGVESANYLCSLEQGVKTELALSNNDISFCIGVEYKTVLTKRESDADIKLSNGADGKNVVGIIRDLRYPDVMYPHTLKTIIPHIKNRLSLDSSPNKYDIIAISAVHNIKSNQEYYYKSEISNVGQYSNAFLEYVVASYTNDPNFFKVVRSKYSKMSNHP